MKGVLHASFLFLHLGFGSCTHVDDSNTAGQLGQTLLKLFAVVIRGGFLNLTTDLIHAALDVRRFSSTFHDGGVFFVDHDRLGPPEVFNLDVLQLDSEVLGDASATSEDRNVFQHGLATVTEARSLDGTDADRSSEFVHHEGGQGFAFDVFGNDHQGFAQLGNLFQQRKQILQVADFLFENQDVRIAQATLHRVTVGDEIGREIPLVELHTLNNIESRFD